MALMLNTYSDLGIFGQVIDVAKNPALDQIEELEPLG